MHDMIANLGLGFSVALLTALGVLSVVTAPLAVVFGVVVMGIPFLRVLRAMLRRQRQSKHGSPAT